jgi:predicted neutral ceramidase superfamily lipid hydrolase
MQNLKLHCIKIKNEGKKYLRQLSLRTKILTINYGVEIFMMLLLYFLAVDKLIRPIVILGGFIIILMIFGLSGIIIDYVLKKRRTQKNISSLIH